jgi:uncharacterized protein
MKTMTTRINQLDVMRGFALLGILIMNIISFGLPEAHYFNPHAEGVLHGWNQGALVVSELFANEKFMGLFSLLFGASVVLFTDKVEGKGRSAWAFHMRRNGWLLVFGLLHAYLLWVGDILVTYAICSVWLFFFRKWSARNLFIASGASVLLLLSMDAVMGLSVPYWSEEDLTEFAAFWTPGSTTIAEEVATMQGSWSDQMTIRLPGAWAMQTEYLPMLALRATAMMLLGMGLYKAGVLNGSRGRRWNGGLAIVGMAVGLAITGWGFHFSETREWSMNVFFNGGFFRSLGMVFLVMGYVGGILWLCGGVARDWLERWLAPLGRMALTNYLAQTVICTTLMYGHGFGMFGTLDRARMWLVIVPIWTVQIIVSKWWMDRYAFGPVEWAWRSLTYWRIQPLKARG